MSAFNLKIQLLSKIGMTVGGLVYTARVLSAHRIINGDSAACTDHAREIKVVMKNFPWLIENSEGYHPLMTINVEAHEENNADYGSVMKARCLENIKDILNQRHQTN